MQMNIVTISLAVAAHISNKSMGFTLKEKQKYMKIVEKVLVSK